MKQFEFYITDSATNRIFDIIKANPNHKFLRISVNGGGCSGFEYDFKFISTQEQDDIIISHNGITVLIDQISAKFLKNATLDYINKLGNSSLTIVKNPNSASSCGCGKSFSAII